ncbi:hypothetical protein FHS86_003263 [Roseimarinus sediminis]
MKNWVEAMKRIIAANLNLEHYWFVPAPEVIEDKRLKIND